MREWETFFTEDERRMYEKAGYKGKDSFGRNPALLIIDVITGFTGTKPMDVMDAIDEFPTSCGKVAWDALPKIQQLLQACREADVPVIYSTSDPDFKRPSAMPPSAAWTPRISKSWRLSFPI